MKEWEYFYTDEYEQKVTDWLYGQSHEDAPPPWEDEIVPPSLEDLGLSEEMVNGEEDASETDTHQLGKHTGEEVQPGNGRRVAKVDGGKHLET